MRIRTYIFLALAFLFPRILHGQIVGDSIEFFRKVQEQDKKFADYERINDSLRKEFNKEPPIIKLTFEKDKKKIDLSNNYEFWYEKDGLRYDPKTIDTNRFLIDSISDTISYAFRFKTDTLEFFDIGFRWIRNGADLNFGLVENLNKIRRNYNKHKNDDDFNKWIDIGQPYLRLIEDKRFKYKRDKTKLVYFLIIQPYVFGDGTIMEIIDIKPKR